MLKLIVALSALSMTAAVSAQTPSPAPATPAGSAEKAQADYLNEKICRSEEVTGSRLTKKKVCKTRAQWADQQLQDRQEIERVQTQRSMKTP
jgi:invasion protein IalB